MSLPMWNARKKCESRLHTSVLSDVKVYKSLGREEYGITSVPCITSLPVVTKLRRFMCLKVFCWSWNSNTHINISQHHHINMSKYCMVSRLCQAKKCNFKVTISLLVYLHYTHVFKICTFDQMPCTKDEDLPTIRAQIRKRDRYLKIFCRFLQSIT